MSDMHSGSNYALFLDRQWHGVNTSHIPRAVQVQIRERFETFCSEVKKARKNKRVILVHNGDATDGDHHHSGDVCSLNNLEQADIHIELMNEMQKRIGWQRGDELYYTRGTKTHVEDFEEHIAKQMNAIPNGSSNVFDLLKLEVNGVMAWFVHHGPIKGKGANEGEPVTGFLKTIYFDAIRERKFPPDIVYTGHTHDPIWVPFGVRLPGFQFKQMHGVILPSWQAKTRFAYMVSPVGKNRIGGVIHEIKADGTIAVPNFYIMESD